MNLEIEGTTAPIYDNIKSRRDSTFSPSSINFHQISAELKHIDSNNTIFEEELYKLQEVNAEVPNEVLILIFSHMSVVEKSILRLVCQNWKAIIRVLSRQELPSKIEKLISLHERKKSKHAAKDIEIQPQLNHYSNFMRQVKNHPI